MLEEGIWGAWAEGSTRSFWDVKEGKGEVASYCILFALCINYSEVINLDYRKQSHKCSRSYSSWTRLGGHHGQVKDAGFHPESYG